jgi:hypothetical protein
MKFLRPLLFLFLLAALILGLWLWWALPTEVDMAAYAPADSLVYIEFENLADVAQAIQQSEVWQAAAPVIAPNPGGRSRILTTAARAGIGPVETVLFARAQIALVVVGLNTSEEDGSLKFRPDFAIIAETHTSRWRTKPSVVEAVKRLADFTYGASMCAERSDNAEYVECSVAGGERKIIGAVEGTLVIVGNSDSAVRNCLEVRRGSRPSLRTDPEMLKVRSTLTTEKTLAFGYVSPANAGRLFSWAAPLLVRQALGDRQFEQLLAVSAGKILRGIAWTATSSSQGIEDRFLFSLEPGIVSRLQPAFETGQRDENFWKLVPRRFQSLTIYRSKEPATAWTSLDSAVAFKLDALPAVLFGTLLRSSLSVYGIENPKEALATLSPPLLTLKPLESSDDSILVARVVDEAKLRQSLTKELFKGDRGEILQGLESNPDPEKEFTAVFADGYVLLGRTENMTSSLAALRMSRASEADSEALQQSAAESSAAIVTYSNDEARVNNFLTTLMKLQGRQLSQDEIASLQNAVQHWNVASTETRLNTFGIERTTRSAFGQFGTFVSLLQPEAGPR